MLELEVGEYVRIIDGEIGKIRVIIDNMIFINNNQYYHDSHKIINHSKNIIDLIEVGDYVNGNRMDIVDRNEKGEVYYLQNEELPCVNKSEIKTILTKEQYNQNCYRLEE